MMWILDPYFNFSICRGRIYALSLLLPACQVLHYTSRRGMDPVLREAQQRWRLERLNVILLFCLAVRFGIGATSPSPSWDSQAGYLWMEFSETKKIAATHTDFLVCYVEDMLANLKLTMQEYSS